MKGRYNVAICGLGRAGSIHTGNCMRNPKIKIKYLVDIDLKRCEQVKQDFCLDDSIGIHPDDFQKVIDDAEVSGVIICTPTDEHEKFVRKCIEGKKAIFCEKPIAKNLKDTVFCYESAEKAGVPLFCAFNRRFDASHAGVKQAVDAGEVGKIHMVKVCSRDSPLPSDAYLSISGGIYHDCAVHDIDMTMWMLKESPTEVFSFAHAFRESIRKMDDVDTVSITMKFPSGAISQIDLSRFATYGYDQRVEVFGELGMLESENQSKTSVRKSNAQSVSRDLIKFSFPTRYPDGYAAEIDHFIEIMAGKVSPKITKMDVALVSLVASACEESHRTGKAMKINKDTLTYEPVC